MPTKKKVPAARHLPGLPPARTRRSVESPLQREARERSARGLTVHYQVQIQEPGDFEQAVASFAYGSAPPSFAVGDLVAAQAAGRVVTQATLMLAKLYAEEQGAKGGDRKSNQLDRPQVDLREGKVAIARAAEMDPSALSRLAPVVDASKSEVKAAVRAIEERGDVVTPNALLREIAPPAPAPQTCSTRMPGEMPGPSKASYSRGRSSHSPRWPDRPGSAPAHDHHLYQEDRGARRRARGRSSHEQEPGATMSKEREANGGGYYDKRREQYFARVTDRPNHRIPVLLPWCKAMVAAVARGVRLQKMVNLLREANQMDWLPNVLKVGAHEDELDVDELEIQVGAIVKGKIAPKVETPKGGPVTFGKFAERWTDGELHTLYPDHVETKKSVRDDKYRLRLLADLVGDVPLVSFTLDHADEAMRHLDAHRRKRAGRDVKQLAPGGRRQYAQIIHRVLNLAAYPARIIKASPLPSGWLPLVPNDKAKGLLYPDEEAQTLGCSKHTVHWRAFFGFLARSGFRADEAAGLTMKDVDLKRGIITLDENKTDDPRSPSFPGDVMLALRLWKERYRANTKPDDLFFIRPDGSRIPIDGLADFYREHFVREAGVDRAELFTRSKSRIKLRVHDLRGFFVTYALAGGATETWVMDRTGHKSSVMVNRYRRVARTVAEAGLGSPVPLHLAIPEFAAAKTAALAAAEEDENDPQIAVASGNHTGNGLIAQSVELRTFKSGPSPTLAETRGVSATLADLGRSSEAAQPRDAAASMDPLDRLTAIAERASEAGEWSVVKDVLGQIERLKIARSDNVFPLAVKRKVKKALAT